MMAVTAVLCGVAVANAASCTNACNGKGLCTFNNMCVCNERYTGGDCSLRKCPQHLAWADGAFADESAHAMYQTCSRMGHCDYTSGQCQCQPTPPFGGSDCRQLRCEKGCGGHGRCLTMEEHAAENGLVYDSVWDHDKMMGCSCDPGWFGFDCSQRDCPRGDDPLTKDQVVEVQALNCRATYGKFALRYKNRWTAPIAYDVDAAALRAEILAAFVPGSAGFGLLADLDVGFSKAGKTRACSSAGDYNVTLTFTQDFGDVPLFQVDPSGLIHTHAGVEPALTVAEQQKGTKENDFCSRRGHCDHGTGTCTCNEGFSMSDGHGNLGSRSDCGYEYTPTIACPGDVPCSGHGVCDTETFRCTCAAGWKDTDCSLRKSPEGKAWFDLPYAENKAHWWSECSNMGAPEPGTGTCNCRLGFTGKACDRINCPGSAQAGQCYGHGRCLTMAELAEQSLWEGGGNGFTYGKVPNDPIRWDAFQMFGCQCDHGWEGHDCSKRVCVRGDDPDTFGQVNEVQIVRCVADNGVFRLFYKGWWTEDIPFNAPASLVEEQLEKLITIESVDVTYSYGFTHGDCTNAAGTASKDACEAEGVGGTWTPHSSSACIGTQAAAAVGDTCSDGVSGDEATCEAAGGTWTFRPENYIRVEFDIEFTKNNPQTLKGHGYSTADVPAMRLDGSKLRNTAADGSDAAPSLLISSKEGECPWCCQNADAADAGEYLTEAECTSKDTVRSHNGLASEGICVMKSPATAQAVQLADAAAITTDAGAAGGCTYGPEGTLRQWTPYTWQDLGPPAQTGTKENLECSNKGTCDGSTGTCHCYLGFGSSDGKGSNGMRMDCGWKRDTVVSPV